ncbi:MAG: cytochrome c-type biogenesis protein CcmH [Deltaproteobacteria bacterium]|nr:cytochrome c-type biogenesis protein CcmH [Deltaproteobacteria bacterium]
MIRLPYKPFVVLTLLLVLWSRGQAPALSEEEVEARVQTISAELRCPTCQALSVKDSEALFSAQMRDKVRSMVREGQSQEEILAYFESRYGEFILRSPKKQGVGLLVWWLPVGGLALGGLLLFFRLAKNQKRSGEAAPSGEETLTPEQIKRIERDLKRYEEGL